MMYLFTCRHREEKAQPSTGLSITMALACFGLRENDSQSFSLRCALAMTILMISVSPVYSKPLVSDISSHQIKITSDFTGITLLMYGARLDPGDIIVVIRGPERDFRVWKKERIWGIWMNRESAEFLGIPHFYTIATGKEFDEIGAENLRRKLQITNNHGQLIDTGNEELRQALTHYLEDESLLVSSPTMVEFIGETLFKSVIRFPSNLPRGNYTAEAYLFDDGRLAGMQATPIRVYKSGFDAFVYDAAQNNPIYYGIAAVAVALFSGWLASEIFLRLK